MYKKFCLLLLVAGCCDCNVVIAQYGIKLSPTLVSINGIGIPVGQSNGRCSNPQCKKCQPVNQATNLNGLGHAAQYVVNRDQRAYDHALREAQIMASRGTSGHPLGCAPGTSFSGTGISGNGHPNHCYSGTSTDRLVARACVIGPYGKYFWSAHYR